MKDNEMIMLTHPVEGDQKFSPEQAEKLLRLPGNKKGQVWSLKENPSSGGEEKVSPPVDLGNIQSQSSKSDANNRVTDQGDIGETKEKGNNPKSRSS